MGWSKLPVAAGDEVKAEQIDELRAAIIERRRAVGESSTAGSGDPPDVAAEDVCCASTINAYRQRVEELFGRYIRTGGSGDPWTKAAIMAEAFGAGRTDWTTVPARAGTAVYASELVAGDVIYAEHANEMKEVIDLLYLVPLEEKSGREYATSDGSDWTWAVTDPDVTRTCGAVGNHQTGSATEHAESAPFDLAREPIGEVTVVEVKARGRLLGMDEDKRVKLVNFVNGDDEDPQPADRAWKAHVRLSTARPADSPRGEDTEVLFDNNLADDGSHTSDGKSEGHNALEVYVDDYWGPLVLSGLPESGDWPFWLTFVVEYYGSVVDAYAAEAAATGRDLQIWKAEAIYTVTKAWAKLDFEYLA
jgi:hypothetical protein